MQRVERYAGPLIKLDVSKAKSEHSSTNARIVENTVMGNQTAKRIKSEKVVRNDLHVMGPIPQAGRAKKRPAARCCARRRGSRRSHLLSCPGGGARTVCAK